MAAASVYCSLTGLCQNLPQKIHVRLVHDVLIVVSVRVNGEGPYDFLLDTGNDTTTVDRSLADKLGLARSGQLELLTVAGRKIVETSEPSTVSLETAETRLSVLIEDLGVLRHSDPHIQGILGEDFLSKYNYLIDYSKRCLRLESENELRDGLQGQRVPLAPRQNLVHDKMIVNADAHAIHSASLRLEIDSGTNILILMNDASKRLEVRMQEIRWEHTLAGNAAVPYGAISVIQLGTVQLHEVVSVSSTKMNRPACDGLLPASLFRALYVNNRENFIVFNPRFDESSRHH
jgi:predicted aspartyl protease